MEEIYTTKIVRVGSSKAIVIPTDVLNGLGWKRGDRVIFTFATDDQLIIKRLSDETIKQLKAVGHLGDEPTIQI